MFLPLIFSSRPRDVDQEGIEPSSKRGNNMLSTCLSSLWFSCRNKTEATHSHLEPLKNFATALRPAMTISDLTAPLYQDASEKLLLSDVSFQRLFGRN